MPEISVIIPVYNVERYIRKCLDSVVLQTFSDIEIICVNDGSTDKSRDIVVEYQKKDKRIKIVDKKNGGLSSARNAGLKAAEGKFISFIDSDDWVDKTMLEKLYNNITALNTDISICAVHLYDDRKQYVDDSNPYFNLEYFNKTFDNNAFTYQKTIPFIMNVCVMAWNKLYRKSFLDECNAKFPEGLIFEDGPFFFSIYFKTRGISVIRDFLYYYRINREGSILQKGGKQLLNIIDVVELMYNSIKDLPEFDQIKNEFYCEKANDIVYRYFLSDLRHKMVFTNRLRRNKYLFNSKIFDFKYIKAKAPITYREIFDIRKGFLFYSFNKNFIHSFIPKLKKDIRTYYIINIKNPILPLWKRLIESIIKFIIYFIPQLVKKISLLKEHMMYKIMEILYTEENIYYIKINKLKFRIKKRSNIVDIWYANDRIFIVLFMKYKINFKFNYSKLLEKERQKGYE